MLHLTSSQHAQMHWRPDAITRTGVIEPMFVRQVSPVDMARHAIDPFIQSVRGMGPAVSPYPSPEDVAYAAGKLAQQFRQGKNAVVCMGTEKITVGPNQLPMGGIVGTITQAAQELARGGTVTIQIGARRAIVCNSGPGGTPVVQPAAPASAAPASIPVRADQAQPVQAQAHAQAAQAHAQAAQAAQRSLPAAAAAAAQAHAHAAQAHAQAAQAAHAAHPVHPAHPAHPAHPMNPANRRGLGAPPLLANMKLPSPVQAGNVPGMYFDYAQAYRELNYNDNVWARRNFQAILAHRYAPQPVNAMNTSTNVPIHQAQGQARPPLHTRAHMVQQRWPHPQAVWPAQAHPGSINVRKEQR